MPEPTAVPPAFCTGLDPALPVTLIPVRVETRFCERDTPGAAAIPVLRVRIFPDDLAVTPAEVSVSATEIEAGQQFWAAHATALAEHPADPAAADRISRGAWSALAVTVGAERAEPVALACRDGAPEPGAAPITAARLLPDAWVITGHRDDRAAFTHYVPCSAGDALRISPAEHPGGTLDPHDPLLIRPDDEARWLVDFDRAREIGMAAEIDLDTLPEVAAAGLDTLVVIGVREPRAGRDADTEARAIAEVLDAHARTGRLALSAQGTTTNNLAGRPSGYTATPDVFAAHRRVVRAIEPGIPVPPPVALTGGSTDGAAVETALGLPAGAISAIDGGDRREQAHARAMANALFPVTLGEIVAVLMRPAAGEYGMPMDDVRAFLDQVDRVMPFLREHFTGYVRGRGPLPCLRIGSQPYGLLPVLAGHFATDDAEPELLTGLATLLASLRPFWDQAARAVPNLVEAAPPATTVSELLGRILDKAAVPHAGGYERREFDGAIASFIERAASVKTLPGIAADAPFTEILGLARPGLVREITADLEKAFVAMAIGRASGYESLLDGTLLAEMRTRATGTPVQMGRPLVTAQASEYLAMLAGDGVPVDIADRPGDLLYLLLEHALALADELDTRSEVFAIGKVFLTDRFLELARASTPIEVEPGTEFAVKQREFAALTVREGLTPAAHAVLATGLGEPRLRELLDLPIVGAMRHDGFRVQLITPRERPNNLAGTKDAIGELAAAGLDPGELARLTGEVLDCCATRLDAWYTSLAVRRLTTLRTARPTGAQLGCWGVLVDVRPRTVALAETPSGWTQSAATTGALRRPLRQVGYVHAPSPEQARTAGVLRAAELAYQGSGSSLATIDLTSERVRTARGLLDGVTNGQPLGALLGYRLERELGDRHRHAAITALRTHYPQRHTTPSEAGSDSAVNAAVVDGLAVHENQAQAAALPEIAGDPVARAAIGNLARAVEAVSDLLVAEGVHAITSGHSEHAGAVLSAIATGTRPPDPAVTAEPRSGTTITHRVVLRPATTGWLPGWNTGAPRAVLAPHAERWAQSVLGPATDWQIGFPGTEPTPLADLGICALDLLADAQRGTDTLIARLRAGAGAAGNATPDDTMYPALFALATSAAEVLAGARPATESDLTAAPGIEAIDPAAPAVVPPPPPPPQDQLDDLAALLAGLLQQLDTAVRTVIESGENADETTEIDTATVRICAELGTGWHLRDPRIPIDDAISIAQDAAGALRSVAAALPAATGGQSWAQRLTHAATEPNRLELLVEVTRRLAGPTVLPTIEVPHQLTESALDPAAIASEDADPQASAHRHTARWLTRLGRVSTKTADYEELRLYCHSRGAATPATRVHQLPYEPGDPWLGAALPPAAPNGNELRAWWHPAGPRAHLIVDTDPELAETGTASAFVIDEVLEVLPAPTVTTGAAIHYDAPSARPPQTILIATPAQPGRPPTAETLTDTVLETLAMSRLRGVDLDDLTPTGIGAYLPLTYVRQGIEGTKPLIPPTGFTGIAELTPIDVETRIQARRVHFEPR